MGSIQAHRCGLGPTAERVGHCLAVVALRESTIHNE